MNRVLIIGSNGSMGKRYQAILKYLGVDHVCTDIHDSIFERTHKFEHASHYIIATPTSTHEGYIHTLRKYERPILCEKPLSRDPKELDNIVNMTKDPIDLQMVNQYEHLLEGTISEGLLPLNSKSFYNYFRTGGDGLLWDCIQIIGLHNGDMKDLKINNDSPVWQSQINGHWLNFAHMDGSYVKMVDEWFSGRRFNLNKHLMWHKKVLDFNSYLIQERKNK